MIEVFIIKLVNLKFSEALRDSKVNNENLGLVLSWASIISRVIEYKYKRPQIELLKHNIII